MKFYSKKIKTKRVTRVNPNKTFRRKTEADAKKLLQNILEEIVKEDKEKEKTRTRRTVVKQERLETAPRCLGRDKYISKHIFDLCALNKPYKGDYATLRLFEKKLIFWKS